jgi:hypothetical protein
MVFLTLSLSCFDSLSLLLIDLCDFYFSLLNVANIFDTYFFNYYVRFGRNVIFCYFLIGSLLIAELFTSFLTMLYSPSNLFYSLMALRNSYLFPVFPRLLF